MHIRQHNTDTGGADHSCSICGKSLSSASSLDRHMLVHSGERPYKCTVCGQSFTTNGNMHRGQSSPGTCVCRNFLKRTVKTQVLRSCILTGFLEHGRKSVD
ncbi:hypothetical protein GH733_016683 [Mirounga leonina]|nr:hypothetical protein GH733_016683 [Mirounga leonina]